MGSGIFVEGLSSTDGSLVQCRDLMWAHTCLLGLNKWRTNLDEQWDLDVGSEGLYRGLNKLRIQLVSIQGHRCALRSVVGVMQKGRTQPNSERRARVGPGVFFGSLDRRCALRSVCQRLYQCKIRPGSQ